MTCLKQTHHFGPPLIAHVAEPQDVSLMQSMVVDIIENDQPVQSIMILKKQTAIFY